MQLYYYYYNIVVATVVNVEIIKYNIAEAILYRRVWREIEQYIILLYHKRLVDLHIISLIVKCNVNLCVCVCLCYSS